jgi:hypothetical protein
MTASGGGRTFLLDLSHEFGRLQAELAAYAEREALRGPEPAAEIGARQVEALAAARHARSARLGMSLVHPGWSLLLELLRAHLEGEPARMPRLATAARVSMTTMLRWLDRVYDAGLAERLPHPEAERGVGRETGTVYIFGESAARLTENVYCPLRLC